MGLIEKNIPRKTVCVKGIVGNGFRTFCMNVPVKPDPAFSACRLKIRSALGVQMAPIIASLGLGGFALGFALKDVISNFLSGVLILIYRPFKEGDYLLVSGCEGKVTEINMRSTILSGENTTYMIPNAAIFTNPLQLKAPEP
jgi:Mechanosensitive ion channel, beta-domain